MNHFQSRGWIIIPSTQNWRFALCLYWSPSRPGFLPSEREDEHFFLGFCLKYFFRILSIQSSLDNGDLSGERDVDEEAMTTDCWSASPLFIQAWQTSNLDSSTIMVSSVMRVLATACTVVGLVFIWTNATSETTLPSSSSIANINTSQMARFSASLTNVKLWSSLGLSMVATTDSSVFCAIQVSSHSTCYVIVDSIISWNSDQVVVPFNAGSSATQSSVMLS